MFDFIAGPLVRCGDDIAVYWTIVMMSSAFSVKKAITSILPDAQMVVEKIEGTGSFGHAPVDGGTALR